jgi:hypothetical protein
LANKSLVFVFCLGLLALSCQKKQPEPAMPGTAQPSISVDSLIATKLSTSSFIRLQGQFFRAGQTALAVLHETRQDKNIGVVITFFEAQNDSLHTISETSQFDGALKHATFQIATLADRPDSLLYYDSGDFFMGSASGEVFITVFGPKTGTLVKGHLFLQEASLPKLFVANTADASIRTFIFNQLKDQYPGLKFVSKDMTID